MQRTLMLLSLTVIAGCSPDVMPWPSESVGSAMQGVYDNVNANAAMRSISVAPSYFANGDNYSADDVRLHIAVGVATPGNYRATSLFLATMHEGWIHSNWAKQQDCSGEARFANNEWTIQLTGAECARWNGVYRHHEPPPQEPAVEAIPSTIPERPLELVPPPPTTPLARALQSLGTLEASDQPCSISLQLPDTSLVESATPGEAALRNPSQGGEEFEIVRVTSGTPLPAQLSPSYRYQALLVMTAHSDPVVNMSDHSFDGGHSRGRAYLVDTQENRVLCIADVDAQNGDGIRGHSESEALMWLRIQLMLSEQRAIALGVRAVRTSGVITRPKHSAR